MKISMLSAAARVALLVTVMAGAGAAHAGYVTLSDDDDERVMKRCNPRHLPHRQRCRVDSLPGIAGYTLVASRSSPIIKNDVTVGTLFDRVWKNAGNDYIFGMRAQLNAEAYDLTGLSFNVNDMFRQLLPNKPAHIAYFMGPSTKALKRAGRTAQGLNEPPPEDDDDEEEEEEEGEEEGEEGEEVEGPVRNNGWVDFRVDANAAEPEGRSSASSPWLLLKTRAPAGFSVKPFALRVLNSDFEDRSEHVEVFLSGYQPN